MFIRWHMLTTQEKDIQYSDKLKITHNVNFM